MGNNKEVPTFQIKRREYPYNSPAYAITQMLSAWLSLNFVYPLALHVTWRGNLWQQGLFLLLFGFSYIVASFLLLAIAGYLAVFIEVARNLKNLKMQDINDPEVARRLAVNVLVSNQPRWLISLTPCVVPACAMAVSCFFFREKLTAAGLLLTDNCIIFLQSCLLHALSSFLISLPFIIKTQRAFNTDIIVNRDSK